MMTALAVHSLRLRAALFSRPLRFRLIGGLALLVLLATTGRAQDYNPSRDQFLRAVAQVETGGNRWAVGKAGERGLYQFSRKTWYQHTKRSFLQAHDPAAAYAVAVKHYNWLYENLARKHRATAFWLAVAWNGGLSRAMAGEVPTSTRHYAERVATLASIDNGVMLAGAAH